MPNQPTITLAEEEFLDAFHVAFEDNYRDMLFNDNSRRTSAMSRHIFPALAKSYDGATIEHDFKGIDAVLFRPDYFAEKPKDITQPGNDNNIIAVIEHENNSAAIAGEIKKLAELPLRPEVLKVLITYTGAAGKYIFSTDNNPTHGVLNICKGLDLQDDFRLMVVFHDSTYSNPSGLPIDDHQPGKRMNFWYAVFDFSSGKPRVFPTPKGAPL
jgi:hypothetical protein